MIAHVIQFKQKGSLFENRMVARPQTRPQDVCPELQNFVLTNFLNVLLKIVLSLRDSTHLILEQTQVNVGEGRTRFTETMRKQTTETQAYI